MVCNPRNRFRFRRILFLVAVCRGWGRETVCVGGNDFVGICDVVDVADTLRSLTDAYTPRCGSSLKKKHKNPSPKHNTFQPFTIFQLRTRNPKLTRNEDRERQNLQAISGSPSCRSEHGERQVEVKVAGPICRLICIPARP
ncbi:hypothetical protein CEXT_136511 [Caerostris extrusa]|uniref:Secreted protein n=1 Tax=Caerostris extrusa TaxID=172846 RepID=A0AAV4U2D4_CAEEX|nr:hypothetical protein CEXT_136511 [Caerostris extrusa]